MSKVDENREYITLATADNAGQAPQALRVDPVTDRLLVEIHFLAEASRTLNSSDIDENNKTVDEVVDDNGVIRPLLIDNRNGYLLIDLVVE